MECITIAIRPEEDARAQGALEEFMGRVVLYTRQDKDVVILTVNPKCKISTTEYRYLLTKADSFLIGLLWTR